jgi:hypothetical protein
MARLFNKTKGARMEQIPKTSAELRAWVEEQERKRAKKLAGIVVMPDFNP